jgi:hypothetical protein
MTLRAAGYLAMSSYVLLGQQAIRELPISEFSQLPEAARQDLQSRGCTVPQSSASGETANVIRGHFRDSQHTDWAVLCDLPRAGGSMLLVFWTGKPPAATVVTSSKRSYENCWTDIAPVGRAFIVEHYRAYGGPKPPPVDHQGINTGCEKASQVFYFYRNHWLTLTGSD